MSRARSSPPGTPALGDIDLRLLKVFVMVVRHGGFSAAQQSLGMNQATISTHMRHLEERLGLRLCERGRGGFLMTEEGKRVHDAALDLFASLDRFRTSVGEAKGELTGQISFGTVDAMVTNRQLGLQDAIAAFQRQAPRVRLDIDVAAPQILSQGLLSGAYDIVLMPEVQGLSQMRVQYVFSETQKLYCGAGNPLFDLPDESIDPALLAGQPFAGRTYMPDMPIEGVSFTWAAATPHMEGTLLLLLSGAYIGFLPDHYAEAALGLGRLRVLAPDWLTFDDRFHIAYSRQRPPRAAELLAASIKASAQYGDP